MAKESEVKVPDIGDFESVEIIDVLVSVGDKVEKEDPLITLESDKASMDIPSPFAGTVESVMVNTGDRVSEGSPILILSSVEEATEKSRDEVKADSKPGETSPSSLSQSGHAEHYADVVILGAGPGGYTAAFRSADLGKKTILIERYPALGGVCLNVGCIPSKALLHVARVISEIEELREVGIELGDQLPDKKPVRTWTETVLNKLTGGLKQMAKQRRVEVIHGTGRFSSDSTITVEQDGETTNVAFDKAIIAAGSQAAKLPGLPDDPRILDSTSALMLENIPERMLVIGGGIIGLEMATVYAALGSRITVVEMLDSLIAECDKDIVRPLQKRIKKQYENIFLNTSVTAVKAEKDHLTVTFDGKDALESDQFDAILVAIGRSPNGHRIGAEAAGINVDDKGFIPVDDQQRTNVPHIFAIGDITGQPMLAHKATHEGKVAAEVIAEIKSGFDDRVIPSVAYTDPEVAWVGLTETEAKTRGIDYGKGTFPWAASGRSLSLGRDEGITKLLFDRETNLIIGAAIVGPNAGELIAECAHAIEMGADAQDIGLTIHPHPTLTETIGMAAEAFEGTITDLYIPKK